MRGSNTVVYDSDKSSSSYEEFELFEEEQRKEEFKLMSQSEAM